MVETSESLKPYQGWSIFLDMDGVVGKMLLRPQEVDYFRPLQLQHMRSIGRQIQDLQELGVSAIINTGRQIGETKRIVGRLGVDKFLCENGAILSNNGKISMLLPDDKKETASYLGGELSDKLKEINYWIPVKLTMCSVQMPAKILQKQDEMEAFKNDLLARAMTFEKFRYFYENGKINCTLNPEAVDFSLSDWDKGKGTRAYLQKYNLDFKKSLAIGDSGSDIPMMEACGFAACPVDASDEVKNYLSGRKGSYEAKLPLTIGTMETLNAFKKMLESKEHSFPINNNLFNPHPKIMDKYEEELKI